MLDEEKFHNKWLRAYTAKCGTSNKEGCFEFRMTEGVVQCNEDGSVVYNRGATVTEITGRRQGGGDTLTNTDAQIDPGQEGDEEGSIVGAVGAIAGVVAVVAGAALIGALVYFKR